MSNDQKPTVPFVEGLRVARPSMNAPSFVKAKVTITKSELMAWLEKQPNETIKASILQSQSTGNWYASIDTWKPGAGRQPQTHLDDQPDTI